MKLLAPIKKSIIQNTVLRKRRKGIVELTKLYASTEMPAEIARYQVDQFNRRWQFWSRTLPFYRYWKATHKLPASIASASDLRDFPPLCKTELQKHADLVFARNPSGPSISTGGSTGTPMRFPINKAQADSNYIRTYTARAWWGLAPLDQTALLWGHAHLFGSGIPGQIAHIQRRLADNLTSTRRLDAYQFDIDTISRYYGRLCKNPPKVLIGYTNAVFKLARFVVDNRPNGALERSLKAVIVTSETVTDADIEVIGTAFNAPVVIEYGTTEAGVIAYSRFQSENLQILWDGLLARTDDNDVLHISTLSDHEFPLVNYCTDDTVATRIQFSGSVLSLRRVLGRSRDNMRIRSKSGTTLELSAILLMHILKARPQVFGIQFEQSGDDTIRVLLQSERQLDLVDTKRYLVQQLLRDRKPVDPASITIVQTADSTKSIAGKQPIFRTRPSNGADGTQSSS